MSLTQTQISQLYVSIFNRASEGEGNQYWQNQGTIAGIANQMLATSASQTYFGTSLNSNQAFIEHIYLNTLNKTLAQDPDGIAYWRGLLDNGLTRGEVVASIVTSIDTYAPSGVNYNSHDAVAVAAYNQFSNRVAVSDYMAQNVFNTPSDYATSTSFSGALAVTDDSATKTNAMNQISTTLVTTHTGDLTEEMISGLPLYNYDTDLYDSNFANGLDALHKMVFNANGTVVEERYTAPFGSSSWTLGESDTSMTWSIVNGKLVVVGSDSEYTWSDNLTLLSQTATGMTFYDQGVEINTMGTSTTADDVTENFSNSITFMFTAPSARTEAQIGLFKETFSGQVNFVNSAGVAVAVPSDAKVALTADHNYDGGRICLDINNDGSFSGFGYTVGDVFTSSSSIEYQIFHDTNNDGNWWEGESSYSGFGQVIDLTGISTPVTVII